MKWSKGASHTSCADIPKKRAADGLQYSVRLSESVKKKRSELFSIIASNSASPSAWVVNHGRTAALSSLPQHTVNHENEDEEQYGDPSRSLVDGCRVGGPLRLGRGVVDEIAKGVS